MRSQQELAARQNFLLLLTASTRLLGEKFSPYAAAATICHAAFCYSSKPATHIARKNAQRTDGQIEEATRLFAAGSVGLRVLLIRAAARNPGSRGRDVFYSQSGAVGRTEPSSP
jgi:hypothetical protein